MRWVYPLTFCAFVAATSSAQAADWYTGTQDQSQPQDQFGASVDTSLSITSQGDRHISTVGTIAPFSKMNTSGLRLSISGDLGDYSYHSSAPGVGMVHGREEDGNVSVGWAWSRDRLNVGLLVGLDVRNDRLDKADPAAAPPGTEIGAKIGAELYANPTPYTMAFGQATFSTVRNAYYVHAKWGIAVMNDVFVGPEALLLGDDFYEQWRVGAHISGAHIGRLQFGLAGGLLEDRSRGAGVYGTLDLRAAF